MSSKYLAINGIVDEVGGRILETSNRKTTIESNTDIVSVIFSPEIASYDIHRHNLVLMNNRISTSYIYYLE